MGKIKNRTNSDVSFKSLYLKFLYFFGIYFEIAIFLLQQIFGNFRPSDLNLSKSVGPKQQILIMIINKSPSFFPARHFEAQY